MIGHLGGFKGLRDGFGHKEGPKYSKQQFPRIVSPFSYGGVTGRKVKWDLNLWHRKDLLAPLSANPFLKLLNLARLIIIDLLDGPSQRAFSIVAGAPQNIFWLHVLLEECIGVLVSAGCIRRVMRFLFGQKMARKTQEIRFSSWLSYLDHRLFAGHHCNIELAIFTTCAYAQLCVGRPVGH